MVNWGFKYSISYVWLRKYMNRDREREGKWKLRYVEIIIFRLNKILCMMIFLIFKVIIFCYFL